MTVAFKRIISVLLAISALLGTVTAFAEDDAQPSEETHYYEESVSAVDKDAVLDIINSVFEELKISPTLVGVGYCYTETNETVFYNGDMWVIPASIYKLPMMMKVANMNLNGEAGTIEKVYGVDKAMRRVLVYSDNSYAYGVVQLFGGWRAIHRQAVELIGWSEEDVPIGFFADGLGLLSPEFVMDVLKELYYNSEQYPDVIDYMLLASPNEYIKRNVKDLPVAQKYGALNGEVPNVYVNHIAGIVYTEQPFLFVVMTQYISYHAAERLIGVLGQALREYTETLCGPSVPAAEE